MSLPEGLHGMVDQFGFDRVYQAGIEVLGFPPTLDPSAAQVAMVADFLQRKEMSNG